MHRYFETVEELNNYAKKMNEVQSYSKCGLVLDEKQGYDYEILGGFDGKPLSYIDLIAPAFEKNELKQKKLETKC